MHPSPHSTLRWQVCRRVSHQEGYKACRWQVWASLVRHSLWRARAHAPCYAGPGLAASSLHSHISGHARPGWIMVCCRCSHAPARSCQAWTTACPLRSRMGCSVMANSPVGAGLCVFSPWAGFPSALVGGSCCSSAHSADPLALSLIAVWAFRVRHSLGCADYRLVWASLVRHSLGCARCARTPSVMPSLDL